MALETFLLTCLRLDLQFCAEKYRFKRCYLKSLIASHALECNISRVLLIWSVYEFYLIVPSTSLFPFCLGYLDFLRFIVFTGYAFTALYFDMPRQLAILAGKIHFITALHSCKCREVIVEFYSSFRDGYCCWYSYNILEWLKPCIYSHRSWWLLIADDKILLADN
ncbi:hypothetical protein L6164_016419 [Bauhinia variegata]|uniref:Uncharacterized protein n=1 Tax=Bauhinia variegata TaxID=167791 RepID=A0ACB9NNK3_BAUVA|nr:hypothetical protein L6164_016419 [Bauhinia variegata]